MCSSRRSMQAVAVQRDVPPTWSEHTALAAGEKLKEGVLTQADVPVFRRPPYPSFARTAVVWVTSRPERREL